MTLVTNQELKNYLGRKIIYNKIQGEAVNIVRSVGLTKTWEAVKKELIKHYSPRESYHQLYHQAFNMRNLNVRNYYYSLQNILNKLNEKFEFDNDKPDEFQPEINHH